MENNETSMKEVVDSKYTQQNIMLEKEFQDMIFKSESIKSNIVQVLNSDTTNKQYYFEKEVEFINGITSDFIIYDNKNTINAIIECKRADIGVTEYVRGVGQLFQYEYFAEKQISPKKHHNLNYNLISIKNVLVIPSSFIRNTNLNIGRFKYPTTSTIIEIHEKNHLARIISKEELKKLEESQNKSLVTICQYYMRDNRIFEYYILLKVLLVLGTFNFNDRLERKEIESEYLSNIKAINNKNWRNAFISLSSLGFIKSDNKVSDSALGLVNKNIYDFIQCIYSDYIQPFVDEIMVILLEISCEQGNQSFFEANNVNIGERIRRKFNNRDVLFLTESKNRYISSWLNIMRDDIGCIDFESRSSKRKINFVPHLLNKNSLLRYIQKYSKSINYVEKFLKNQQQLFMDKRR